MAARPVEPSFVELFTPKLVTVLREGYRLADLRADAIAGLTVAIVALPLSMAIAMASGVTPDRGLYTSIIGGFLVSALGGSRFQIGGPAGAFIVLVSATVAAHGVDGLILATLLSGIIFSAIGLLRLGTFIKYIPFPVTVGFHRGHRRHHLRQPDQGVARPNARQRAGTADPQGRGDRARAADGQRRGHGGRRAHDRRHPCGAPLPSALAGLHHCGRRLRPAACDAQPAGRDHRHTLRRHSAVAAATASAGVFLDKVTAVLPAALSFALLGGIESLLSAVVADSMSGRRHRSNCELVAQGVANIASALFGGICVTGKIARTATNVRSGARGPVAGMLHSVFLLLFMLLAAPFASTSRWRRWRRACCGRLEHGREERVLGAPADSRGDAVVLLATFLLVVFRDLTEGILAGFGIGALLFLHRMAGAVDVENMRPAVEEDRPDSVDGNGRAPYDVDLATDPDVVVYRISGAFFFGAAAGVGAALDRIGERPKAYVIDLSAVPLVTHRGPRRSRRLCARRTAGARQSTSQARPVPSGGCC